MRTSLFVPLSKIWFNLCKLIYSGNKDIMKRFADIIIEKRAFLLIAVIFDPAPGTDT